jgi:hypothetical protein
VSAAGAPDPFQPYRLWSLWEMLELKAASFYGVTSGLLTLRARMGELIRSEVRDEKDGGITFILENDPVAINFMRQQASELIDNLRTLGVSVSLMSATKLWEVVSNSNGFLWSEASRFSEEIHSRLVDELSLTKVFVLERGKVGLYDPVQPLFGAEVASKYPTDGAFEIDEAAKCLAFGRPTAAVFHLMRTMEIAIRAVARCLQIPDPVRPSERNWGFILSEVKKGIDAKWPTGAGRMSGDGALFESLYASLEAVRNPWRNATMHVENKYTDDEAEHIFVAVRGFMKNLASRCDENGEPKA